MRRVRLHDVAGALFVRRQPEQAVELLPDDNRIERKIWREVDANVTAKHCVQLESSPTLGQQCPSPMAQRSGPRPVDNPPPTNDNLKLRK
jgi:hypothetical protein